MKLFKLEIQMYKYQSNPNINTVDIQYIISQVSKMWVTEYNINFTGLKTHSKDLQYFGKLTASVQENLTYLGKVRKKHPCFTFSKLQ